MPSGGDELLGDLPVPGGGHDAVLAAAGHRQPLPKSRRSQHPGGLTGREAGVPRLVARSLTTREIADRLYISAKTADHHIQHALAG